MIRFLQRLLLDPSNGADDPVLQPAAGSPCRNTGTARSRSRRAARRSPAGDALCLAAFGVRLHAGRAQQIPFVGHELFLIAAAADDLLRAVVHGVIRDTRAQPEKDMVLAAGLVEPSASHPHRDALDDVRLAALRIPLQRSLHLREERVGEVRPQRLDVLRRPAVLHLHIEIRRLLAQRRRVKVRIDLRIFADGRERGRGWRGSRHARRAGRSLS